MRWRQKIALFLLVKPVYWLLFKFKVDGLEYFKDASGPLLIVGNHKSIFDSLAIGAIGSFFSKLHPVQTMGETKNFRDPTLQFICDVGLLKIAYWLFAVFPAVRGQGLDKALETSIKIIKNNGVVFIHPEGKVIPGEEIGQFKRGAAYLALKTGVDILPVVFKLDRKSQGIFFKPYHIKFGPIFTLPKNLSVEEGAEYMRSNILDLYNTLPQ